MPPLWPGDFIEALQKAYVSFENKEYFEALYGDPEARFVAVEADFYDESISMLRAIGALEEGELHDYPYDGCGA